MTSKLNPRLAACNPRLNTGAPFEGVCVEPCTWLRAVQRGWMWATAAAVASSPFAPCLPASSHQRPLKCPVCALRLY